MVKEPTITAKAISLLPALPAFLKTYRLLKKSQWWSRERLENYQLERLEKLGLFDVALGMKGDKMALGEERKLLELYRATTPDAEQKVYYDLECYIKHYVPEYKMKIKYLVKRSYTAGRISRRISSVHHGKSDGKDKTNLFLFLAGLCGKGVSRSYNNLKADGLRGVDYVGACRIICVYAGAAVEKLSVTFKRERK